MGSFGVITAAAAVVVEFCDCIDPQAQDLNLARFDNAALWSGTNKNRDVSTGPLARPFAHSLALLTRSLAQHCSVRLHSLLRSLVCSFAHFAHSLVRGTVND